jgi:hypothetical protein
MAERSDDLLRSRQEAAVLLRLDPQNLSPADELRCDLISTLRLSIDGAQADALEGRAADLGRLIVATEALVKLLPGEPPKTESQHGDPRVEMYRIYKQMRERGEIGLKPDAGQVEALQDEVATLKVEIAELKGQSSNVRERGHLPAGAAPAPLDVPTSDIVPPGEIGSCHARHVAGPDDPPRRSTRVIEGNAAAATPAAPRNWDETDNGKRWQAWHDAGVGGGSKYWGPV